MNQKKLHLLVVLFVFSAFLVYGSAIASKLLTGSFLLPNALFDWGYVHLVLSLFLPVCLYASASHKGSKHTGKVAFGGLGLSSLIYVPVYLTLGSEPSGLASIDVLCLMTLALVFLFTAVSYLSFAYTKPLHVKGLSKFFLQKNIK